MVSMKEYEEKLRKIEARTGVWERLGFCPHCEMVSMMVWYEIYDNEAVWHGRVCNECNYVSEYHTDIVSSFIDEPLERRLRDSRGPRAILKELRIGHYGETG